ncbi:MAG: PKD domain-containing protein [Rubrivivax sp.]|nr:MAG: PKD domain-containing protein [Rubrivivax sp.]
MTTLNCSGAFAPGVTLCRLMVVDSGGCGGIPGQSGGIRRKRDSRGSPDTGLTTALPPRVRGADIPHRPESFAAPLVQNPARRDVPNSSHAGNKQDRFGAGCAPARELTMLGMNILRAPAWAARLLAVVLMMALAACGGGGGGGGSDAGANGTPPPVPLGVTISGVAPAATVTGGSIKFTSAATGGTAPYTYQWAFGDGVTLGGAAAGAVVDHAFASASRYSVLLTVTDAAGKRAEASTFVVVESPDGLSVQAANAGVYSVGQPVTVWASSLSLTPVQFDWDFGDGRTAQGANPQLAYAAKGQYTISVVATYDNGIKRRASTTVNVSTDAPTLSISAPALVYLQNGAPVTVSPALEAGESVSLEVDGQAFASISPTYNYVSFKKTGTYEVKATRRNTTGATAVATFSVTVQEPTVPSGLTLSVSQTSVKPGEASASVYLSGNVTGDNTNPSNVVFDYRWDFGDGSPASTTYGGVIHTFPATGTYTVTLTVKNQYGLTSSATGTISVGPRQVLKQLAGESVSETRVDGPALQARFRSPNRLAFDAAGNLFIGDAGNSAVRKLTPQGVVSTVKLRYDNCGVWGDDTSAYLAPYDNGALDLFMTCGGLQRVSADGTLLNPTNWTTTPVGVDLAIGGVARAADGALAFAGSSVIRRLETDGTVTYLAGVLNAYAGNGADGQGIAATFNGTYSIGYDAAGALYVAESNRIRKVSANGTVTTVAGRVYNGLPYQTTDGQGAAADFTWIRDIAVAADGTVLVLQDDGKIRKITPAGLVSTLPVLSAGRLRAIAVAPDGTVVVADAYQNVIQRINADFSLTTIAGTPPAFARIDGAANAAAFWGTSGIAQGPSGAIYVADGMNHALRKISPSGQVTTLAVFSSNSVQIYGTTPYLRSIPRLGGVAVDDQENVYVADSFMNVIRKVAPDGTQSVLAGEEGTMGYANGPAAQARFYSPLGVAVDAARNVYVADFNHAIRKITPAGVVSTIAGIGGYPNFQDGTGNGAYFNFPSHLTAAPDGTVYVSDYGNARIRKITPAGVVTTIAGRANGSYCDVDGPLGANCAWAPMGLALDPVSGELYIAANYGVLRLRTDGWLEKVLASDNSRRTMPGWLPANLNTVEGVAVLSNGQLAMTSGNAVMVTAFQP